MIKTAVLTLTLGMALSFPAVATVPLQPVAPAQVPPELGLDRRLWKSSEQPGDRWALISAIDRSLRYLRTPAAVKAYANYKWGAVPNTTQSPLRQRVIGSLQRFRQLLLTAKSPVELNAAVKREFNFYRSVGQDGQGTVAFTGYFEPVYFGSRVRTSEYRYPLYRLPANFSNWSQPQPTRTQLEGVDGLQASKGLLRGSELVWLRDRLEAYLVQVQGSARLQLTDGSVMTVGYAGKTNYPYVSLGKELVKAGKFRPEELSLPVLIQYFQQNPQDLNLYLPRNQSFVFFRETQGAPATGSLGLPVVAERSIATDKSIMPPGALALLYTQIPERTATGQLEQRLVSRYALDQDTGSAIKGPGRVDIFMGTGNPAKAKAGLINGTGQLYYLLLKRGVAEK